MADVPPPRLVVFDVDGVLDHYDRDVRVSTLADALGRPPELVRRALFGSDVEHRADEGEIDTDTYLAELGRIVGVEVPRAAWVQARAAAMTARPEVLDLARRAGTQATIAALTNNPVLLEQEIATIAPEIAALFGDRFHTAAGLAGVGKPDRRVFETICRTHGAAPADTFFVDDDEGYVAGALAAGLRAHRFVSADDLRDRLGAEGLRFD